MKTLQGVPVNQLLLLLPWLLTLVSFEIIGINTLANTTPAAASTIIRHRTVSSQALLLMLRNFCYRCGCCFFSYFCTNHINLFTLLMSWRRRWKLPTSVTLHTPGLVYDRFNIREGNDYEYYYHIHFHFLYIAITDWYQLLKCQHYNRYHNLSYRSYNYFDNFVANACHFPDIMNISSLL